MKKILTFVSILFVYSTSIFADQGVSDGEIMLGMHTDISGPVASFGKDSVEGAKTRVEAGEAAGGINGGPGKPQAS